MFKPVGPGLTEKEKKARRDKRLRKFEENKTSEDQLIQILKDYEEERKGKKKYLVLCHGHKHKKKFPHALLLDYDVDVKPDIVLDVYRDMNMFPPLFFDVIIMEYCFLLFTDLFGAWRECINILKENGEIRNNVILDIYTISKLNLDFEELNENKKKKIIREVLKSLKEIGFENSIYEEKRGNKYIVKAKK